MEHGRVKLPKGAQAFSIPMSYLREGDRFVAINAGLYGIVVVTGVADMDGHKVSSRYGSRVGNRYFEAVEQNYINVLFDGLDYGLHRSDYRVNSGMYERDGWTFYVSPEIHARYIEDAEWNRRWGTWETYNLAQNADAVLEAKKRRLQEQVAQLQKEIEEL